MSEASSAPIYRCSRCGIESKEPTCFVGVAGKGAPVPAVTCITCYQPVHLPGNLRGAFGVLVTIVVPIFLLLALKGRTAAKMPELMFAALIMLPLQMLLHELGHFLTARLLGLDAILITLGSGPKLWSGRLLGVPLRIHAWPLIGLTRLGSSSMRFLRLRIWITVLMGPTTNLLLIMAAIVLWDSLV